MVFLTASSGAQCIKETQPADFKKLRCPSLLCHTVSIFTSIQKVRKNVE